MAGLSAERAFAVCAIQHETKAAGRLVISGPPLLGSDLAGLGAWLVLWVGLEGIKRLAIHVGSLPRGPVIALWVQYPTRLVSIGKSAPTTRHPHPSLIHRAGYVASDSFRGL